jgi:hypothetical protein
VLNNTFVRIDLKETHLRKNCSVSVAFHPVILSSDIYIADLHGRILQLTDTPELFEEVSYMSRDGKHIAFVADDSIYIAEVVKM